MRLFLPEIGEDTAVAVGVDTRRTRRKGFLGMTNFSTGAWFDESSSSLPFRGYLRAPESKTWGDKLSNYLRLPGSVNTASCKVLFRDCPSSEFPS